MIPLGVAMPISSGGDDDDDNEDEDEDEDDVHFYSA